MKKLLIVSILFAFVHPLCGQTTITIGQGSSVSVGNGSAVTANYRDGTMLSSGTFNGRSIVLNPVAAVATSIAETSLNANWNASAGATGYKLDVSTDPNFASFVTGYSSKDVGIVSTFSVTGLVGGTTYYYRVRAYDIDGITGYSNVITQVTAPVRPTATSATNMLAASFNANWGAVAGVTGYYLDVASDSNFISFITGWQNKNVGLVTTFSVNTDIAGGTIYYYRVRSVNAGGTSASSNTISVLTVPPAPVLGAVTALAQTSFQANWSASVGATKYFLDVSTLNTFASFVAGWNNVDVGNITTYPVATGLSAGTTYYSRVRAFDASGTSTSSNIVSLTTIPPTPVATAATAITQTSFSANWNPSPSATRYFIDVATDSLFTGMVTGWTNVDMDNVTTFSVGTNLTAGTAYYYRIRSYSASGTSTNSNFIGIVTIPPAPVTTAATNTTNTSFSANWNATDGATKYYLDVSTNSTFSSTVAGWDNVDVGNVTTHSVNAGLAGGITYYFRVRATNAAGSSVNSNATTLTLIPPEPVSTSATGIATTSFNANWGTATNATTYFLDVATDNTFTSMVTGWSNVDVGNVTTYSVNSNLSAGTNYYYRLRSMNATGTSGNSGTIALITAPVAPTATSASDLASNSFKANWDPVVGATGYHLDVSTTTSFDPGTFVTGYENLDVSGVTSYSVASNVSSGTTYYYRVRSYNAGGTSGNSNQITFMTLPSSPVTSAATSISASGFTANWNSSWSATGYRLDVSTASDFSSFVAGFNGLDVANVLTYGISGLNANTMYYYRVRAYNNSGTGGSTSYVSVLTAPAAPTTLAASPMAVNGFTANWNSIAGATGYYLDVSTVSDFSTFVSGLNALDVGNVTSYLVLGLSSSSTYYYRVRAYSTTSPSGNSDVRTVITLPPAPVASAATAMAATSFTANWDASTAATGYRLDVATDAAFASLLGSYSDLDVGNVTTRSVTGLTSGTAYYYRVRAYSGSGTNGNSNVISVTTIPPAPAEQAATAIVSNGFSANWSAASGATGYRLDVSTANTFASFVAGYSDLDVGNVVTYPVTGLSAGTAYYYRIRAYNTGGTSSSSGTINPTTSGVAPRAPASVPASSIATTSFSANWAASTGATSYRLDVATSSGFGAGTFVTDWQSAEVGNVTTYTVNSNLSAGTQYYYRVRAVNGSDSSGNSSTISLITVPSAPVEQAAATITTSGFDAKWNASAGATGYKLDVATNSGFGVGTFVSGFENLDANNGTTFAIPGLTGGTSYYYRIRAYNTGGTSSNSGTQSVVTLSPSPVATAATTIAGTSFDANWNASSAATGYQLDVATNSGFGAGTFVSGYEALTLGNVLTRSVSGLTAGITYYYRVRATNGSGTDGNSNVITVATIPASPTEQAATLTTSNGFAANWLASTGATGYELDVATDPGFGVGTFVAGYEDIDVGNVLTYPVTGLLAGTAYHYRIRAYNTGGTSSSSGTINPTTSGVAPRAPASIPASTIAGTSFSANWSASSGATSYRLDVSSVSNFASYVTAWQNVDVGNVTTYSVNTNLTEGTQYYYRVRAVNAAGTSGNSSTISVVTVPPAPIDKAATTVLNNSFDANWFASTGAAGYKLDVSDASDFSTFVSGYNNLDVGNVTTYTVAGLAGGTPYYYRIRAYNTGGTSASSFTINPTTSADPVGTVSARPASSIGETSFNANWAAFAGATGYRLDVSTLSDFSSFVTAWQNVDVGNVTTFAVNTNLTGGTVYYYRVRAYDGGGTIGSSGTVSLLTAPSAPTASAASSWGETYFSANWSSSTGATGYYIDVATDAGFTSFVTGFNDKYVDNVTTYSVTGLSAGTQYYYRVRAKNGSGVSGNSGSINTYTIPKEPTTTAASTVQSTSFSAHWSASAGATKYYLDVSTDPAFGSFVAGWNNTDVANVTTYSVNTGLSSGTVYHYRLRAYNTSGTTGNSSIISVTTAPAAPTANNATAVDKTDFTANWTASTGATKYFVDVATTNTFVGGTFVTGYQDLDVGNTTSILVNGLAQGGTYYYRVRAFNSNGTSSSSGTKSALTLPAAPAVLPVTVVGETSFTAAWNSVAGATGYKLDVSTVSGFATFVTGWNNTDVGNVTSKSVNTGLSAGTTYYFRVRAYNATGTSDDSETISTATTPAAPTATAATSPGETQFVANWNSTTGATGYYLDVATDAGFSSFVAGFNNKYVNSVTTYSITGLTAGTQYYYQVRAKNGSGVSSSSGSINTYTIPKEPTTTAASTVQSTSFTANWSASTGATKYYLDVATDLAFAGIVTGWNAKDAGNVTTYSINTGLSSGTVYYYRLRSSNTSGTSGNSSLISLTTAPAAPTANNASAVNKTDFTANWSASTGATKYFVDVATTNTFVGGTFVTGYQDLDVGNTTSILVNGLAQGGTYYYRVRAFNSNGTSSNSGTKSALTLPAAPAVLPVTVVGETSFTAAWNSVTSATKYYLDVSTSSTFASYVPNWQNVDVGNVTSKSVNTDLSAATTYYFRVRACNATGTGDNSGTMNTATAPPTPTATAATSPGETQFVANWNTSAGAAGYRLDVSTVSSFASFVSGFDQKDVGNITSYTVTGLTGGSTYYYRVSAYLGTKYSSYSGTITALTAPTAPTTIAPSSIGETSLNANWNSATGASGYYLDVAPSSSFASFVAGFNNKDVSNVTTYNVTGLSAHTTYSYRVRAYNASGTGTNSNTTSGLTLPAAPTVNAATAVTNITLVANWNAIAGVAGYRLDASSDPAFGSFVFGFNNKDVGNVTAHTVTGLNGGITYYYRVRAYNSSGIGASSSSITTTTEADPSPAPVSTDATALAQTSFQANWNAAATATGYKLDVATDLGFTNFVSGYQDLNVGNVLTYSATGLAAGTTYYFRTRSYNATGTSSNSNVKTVLTVPADPVSSPATSLAGTSFTANWNASTSAAAYYLDVATDPGFTSFVGVYNNKDVGNVTTLSISGLSAGTTYHYRVRAYNASGTSGNSAAVSALTRPDAPLASAATSVTTTGFSANWTAATGASNYYFDLSTDPAFGSFVTDYENKDLGNVVTYPVAGLTIHTTYYYRVRANNTTGTSLSSGTVTVVGISTANAATSITASGFDANWTAVAGATKYYLDVATDNMFTAFVAGFNDKDVGSVSVYSLTGLSTGTTYYFRVRASNATGTSPNSAVRNVVTIAADPVATIASGIASTSFNANWNAVTGAAGYYVSVAVDSPLTIFVSGWENKDVGNVTAYSIATNISGGTIYYYEVRAYNAGGVSGSSNIIDVRTKPSVPVLSAATATTPTSFTINWEQSDGATKYYLDVATDDTFLTFFGGMNNTDVGTVISYPLSGLTTGTTYYYRVRASGLSGTSVSSDIGSNYMSYSPVVATIEGTTVSVMEGVATPITGTLTVSDVDNPALRSAKVEITNNYQSGEDLLSFEAANGISATWNQQTGILTLSGASLIANYQAALRSVTYQNTSQNPNTEVRTVRFSVFDSSSSSNTLTRDIVVTPVNNPPVVAGMERNTLVFTEGSSARTITDSLTAGDPDNGTLSRAEVQITGNYRMGQDTLTSTSLGGISAIWNASTGTLELTGSATLENYQSILRSVAYQNTSKNPSALQRTIDVVVRDDEAASNVATRLINVVAINDSPVLSSIETGNLSFTEGGSAIALTGTILVSDVDDTLLTSSVVRITRNYQTGYDSLAYADGNGIAGTWDASSGTLTLTGASTPANYQAALRGIAYRNTSVNPGNAVRTVTFTVRDGTMNSNTVTRDITVTLVNNAPVLASMESSTLKYVENAPPLVITDSLTVRDLDSPLLSSALVQITHNYQTGYDTLAYADGNSITGTWHASSGTLTLTGASTPANYQAALRRIAYRNTSVNPGIAARTITFTVNDSTKSSNTVSRDIGVTPINSAPVLASMESSMLKYVENSPPLVITDSLTIRDLDSPMLCGASISITGNYRPGEDLLSFNTAPGIVGSWNSQTGILTLTGDASLATYQAALRSIAYSDTAHPPSTLTRAISFTLSDGTDNSNTVTRSISVARINRPPTVANIESAGLIYRVKQDELQLTNTLTVHDVDSPELMSGEITISGNYVPGEDTLLYTNQNGIVGSWDPAGGALRVTGKGTTGGYQAALRSVRYLNKSVTPTTLPREVSFAVHDEEGASAAAKRTVMISGTNVAPVLSGIESAALKYPVGSTPLIVSASITASDPDNKNLLKAEVKIVQGLISDEDSLSATVPSALSAAYDTKAGLLTISGQDLVSLYSGVLQSVKYQNKKGNIARKSLKRISYTIWDGVAWSDAAARDVDVDGIISSVESLAEEIPKEFALRQNFPNPFNPRTTIHFGVPIESQVTLTIYDMQGKIVKTLVEMQLRAGSYKTTWIAANVSSGVYFCRMEAAGIGTDRRFTETKKLMLLK